MNSELPDELDRYVVRGVFSIHPNLESLMNKTNCSLGPLTVILISAAVVRVITIIRRDLSLSQGIRSTDFQINGYFMRDEFLNRVITELLKLFKRVITAVVLR